MLNERFSKNGWSKLFPKGNGLFQFKERINDKVYKLDLAGEYNVSVTFNMSDLSLFYVGDDSRMNHFKERRNDED